MTKMLKRIPLSSLELEDLASPSGSGSGTPDVPDNPSYVLPELSPSFSFAAASSPHTASVDFSFPADDYRRVQAWFTGDFSHVTLPESTTLKKNMTAAVKDAIDNYLSSASARNLFISPFMIGWRLRLFDGSTVAAAEPLLLCPSEEILRLVISSYNVYEKALHTDVTFSQSASRLLVSLPAPGNASDFLDIITEVEFFICAPAALYPSSFTVSGIRSVTSGGVRERVWHWTANDMEMMKDMVKADSNFRVIASVPFSDIASGAYSSAVPLPMEAGALSGFSSMPKLSARVAAGTSGSTAYGGFTGFDGWQPYLHFQTPALDLSLPDNAKSVCDLYLRGVFQRDKVVMSLYGSHHREGWRLLARSHGPYIRGLRRVPCRWLRVEVEVPMRRDDFLDALVFGFHCR